MSCELNESQLNEVSGGSGQHYGIYTVVEGDDLSRIARIYRTSIMAIMELNPIITDRYSIVVGWVLKVPDNR